MIRKLTPTQTAFLRRQIVRVARGNLGYGEEDSNNRGLFLRAIGAREGAPWCAYFAWYCIRRAAEYAELEIPGFRGSSNARRLGLAVMNSANGYSTDDVSRVLPGDLVVIRRGSGNAAGHVRIVEDVVRADGRLPQIDGNAGSFPSVVARQLTDPTKKRLVGFYGFR